MQAGIKAVLLDLDGTFADTAPDLGAALNHVLSLHNLPPLPLSIIRPEASHGSVGLLKIGFNITPESPQFAVLREAFLDYYSHHICDHTTLFPGMAQLINALEKRNLPWGIVTNKPHRFTLPLMQALGYAERAACLVSGDTCTRAKPYPDPLLKACEMLLISPQETLYLGDDKRDMEAANAANMPFIIADYGYPDTHENFSTGQSHCPLVGQGSVHNPMELLNHLSHNFKIQRDRHVTE